MEAPSLPGLSQQLQESLDRKPVGFLSTSSSSPPSVSENDDSCRLTLIRFLGSGNLCQPSARRASAQGSPQGGRAIADGAARGADQPPVPSAACRWRTPRS